MSINVTVVGATGVSAAITNSAVVDVTFGTAFQAQVPSLMVEAGANITVTTTSGSFTVIGRDVPVSSVQGRTGAVVLTRADLTAAASMHTHSATDIVGLPAGVVASVNGRTGTVVLTATDLTAAALTHTHTTAAIDGYVAPTVFSINGRTGTVTLTASDVTAASAAHAHNVADITDFAAQSAKYGPVSSINGRTGTVTISATDLTCAPLIHTHAASFISDFAAEAAKYGPVASVNGRTGAVVISRSEITAAAATHMHATSDIVGLTSVANVVSVAGRTGVVTLGTADVTNLTSVANVVSVAGRTGVVTLGVSDITNFTSVANVVSVNGRTGVVTLSAADVTNLTSVANVVSVQGRTGVVTLNSTLVSAASAVHSHVAASITDLTSVANVVSVAGRTGAVTLSAADVTGLAAVATSGSAADLSGTLPNARLSANVVILDGSNLIPSAYLPSYVDDVLEYANLAGFPVTGEAAKIYVALDNNKAYRWSGSAYIEISPSPGSTDSVAEGSVNLYFTSGRAAAAAPVQSVNTKSGTVVLTSTDVSAASAVHSHVAASITDLTSVANVVSVAGRTGVVTINAADIAGLASVANVVSVNGITGTPAVVGGTGITVSTAGSSITIAAGSSLPPQGGYSGPLVTDGTNASWTSRYSIVDPVIQAGAGMVLTRDTSAGTLTLAAAGGTSGLVVGAATPQPLGTAAAGSAANASREDHVHAMPTAAQVGAASAVHTHAAADISNLTSVANVISVNGITGTPAIVAGANVTVTTAASSITIAAASGGGGSSSPAARSLTFVFRN